MLRVLVVDDDKMARKGIIAEMPWSSFNMEVVGEASNGELALQFMEQHEVDLLLTDLAMPVMSGLDLMREVRRRYSHIWIAVLTFHQDFELIQEALRVGAIDYIAKTQLEQAKMEDVLGRIQGRIQSDVAVRAKIQGNHTSYITLGGEEEYIYLFISLEASADQLELLQCSFVHADDLQELHYGIWGFSAKDIVSSEEQIATEMKRWKLEVRWMVLKIHELGRIDKKELRKLLIEYKQQQIFYEYKENKVVYPYTVSELAEHRSSWSDDDVNKLRERAASLEWVISNIEFNAIIHDMDRLRLPISKIEFIFYTSKMYWHRIIPEGELAHIEAPGSSSYWTDWVAWLTEIRAVFRSQMQRAPYTDEIKHGIMKAIDYINGHIGEEIRHHDLADIANMSKGYFSQCFKGIAGKTFQEYIRDVRIENARLLLEQTEQSIIRIALQCGYPNEKYFSRVFRDQMGLLPREYRNSNSKR